ncbi:MAG TPA: hypothetical protein VF849_00065 [Blattabacteriaceae bacterium]
MTKEQKLTEQFNTLTESIKDFIKACPEFPEGFELVKRIGINVANVETTLHWEFNCLELGVFFSK